MQKTQLRIKNMVCDRCKMAVEQVLKDVGLTPERIDLGEVWVSDVPTEAQLAQLKTRLEALGFELLDDQRQQMIERMKTAIIALVHHHQGNKTLNLSVYLSQLLHRDYSALSKLFSEVTGLTIERYFIMQRIERVKELIRYDELTLTEIAYQMNYSSVAHLSSQFRSVTGMTPTQFRFMKTAQRANLDEVGTK
ncbi:helix-turn-helix domain-containing protein [Segatella oulorum]|uniref:helix-turn-helix domain-containing protein n=1 Tax=Segatella oulorum TaxID=28136 RepID=UPI0023F3EAAD|nr:AraC family transcriptional regulator [Segatella oulorum]